jgi:hypothetical protein
MLRAVLVVLGTVLTITGVIWIFQGTGFLKGSFMTNSAFWAGMGGIAMVVGVPLLLFAFRRTKGL